MNGIRQYLLSVTAAAILCAVLNSLTENKTTQAALVKLVAGIFLTVTVLLPWTRLDMYGLSDYWDHFAVDGNAAASAGASYAYEETAAIIKSQTQAYILDKASSLGAVVNVDVKLSNDTLPIPSSVTISGSLSPYAKERLKRYIADELNIPEEQQAWI